MAEHFQNSDAIDVTHNLQMVLLVEWYFIVLSLLCLKQRLFDKTLHIGCKKTSTESSACFKLDFGIVYSHSDVLHHSKSKLHKRSSTHPISEGGSEEGLAPLDFGI